MEKRIEIKTEPGEDSRVSPEKMLLIAMIDRAVLDLQERVFVERWVRRDAYRWLTSLDTHDWSFIWVCRELGIDNDSIRQHVIATAHDIGTKRKIPYRVFSS